MREILSETMIPGPPLVIRYTFYTILLVVLFLVIIKFQHTKNIFIY
jgi:hypothetical protein